MGGCDATTHPLRCFFKQYFMSVMMLATLRVAFVQHDNRNGREALLEHFPVFRVSSFHQFVRDADGFCCTTVVVGHEVDFVG